MSRLEKLVEQYEEFETFANKDISEWPAATRPGAQMRQREAKDNVTKLGTEIKGLVLGSAVSIFVTGAKADVDAWASESDLNGGTITASAQALYEDLAKDIEPSLGDRRQFGTGQLGMLISAMTRIGKELDFRNIPTPQIFDVATVKTTQALIKAGVKQQHGRPEVGGRHEECHARDDRLAAST